MPDEIVHTLRLPFDLRDQLMIHLIEAAPNEGVGLLAVRRSGGLAEATAFYPGENIDASPFRYTMHPRDVVTALQSIEREGWELGAVVHSHLRGPASPSRTDIAEAHYPGAMMVIVSLAHLPPDLRAWYPDPGEEGLVMRRVRVDLTARATGEDPERDDTSAAPDPCAGGDPESGI